MPAVSVVCEVPDSCCGESGFFFLTTGIVADPEWFLFEAYSEIGARRKDQDSVMRLIHVFVTGPTPIRHFEMILFRRVVV